MFLQADTDRGDVGRGGVTRLRDREEARAARAKSTGAHKSIHIFLATYATDDAN